MRVEAQRGMKRRREILYATDFSIASQAAFAEAIALARGARARLAVLHVMVPPSPFMADELPASWVELEARAHRDGERKLAAAISRAERSGVEARGELVKGIPAETIVRAARRARAEVIVIGTHGRSGLGRLFMGSVASRVLQLAGCPVLTVRGRARKR